MAALHVVRSDAALAAPVGQPLVVLVHGAMDRSASFARTSRLLADLPMVRYDRRGYGRSTPVGVGDLAAHVDDLLAVLDGRPGVVVGHSLGGVVALVAASRRPHRIRSVAAWEAPMPWADWWPASSAGGAAMDTPLGASAVTPSELTSEMAGDAAERFMRRMVGDSRWRRMPARTRADRRAEGRALLADLGSLRIGTAPYDASGLELPVLAGAGTDSLSYHRRAARELAANAPHGELVEIPGATHGVHLSHPRKFAAFVRRAVVRATEADATGDERLR